MSKDQQPGLPTAGPADQPLRRRRRWRWVFRLTALALPVVVLLVAELLCRWGGYGGYPPVLRELGTCAGRTYVGTNQPGLSTFFFQNLTEPGSMEDQVFTTPKPPGTVRIFILGGSAARGYPQPRNLAASAFLEAWLAELWPERKVEVLNLGTTALASFPQMYIVDEVLAFEPDLVIVYSGNNEFYGAHGVASVHAFGQSTLAMQVFRAWRSTGLGHWLTDVSTRRKPAESSEEGAAPLMERVMAHAQIPPGSPRRAAAARNLENHLTYVAEQCVQRSVPVILCTLPVNEGSLHPIGEDVAPDLPPDQQDRFAALLAQGQAMAQTAPAQALAALDEAAELWDLHAGLHFARAQCLAAQGQPAEARVEHGRAIDLDTMPWRPTSACQAAVPRAVAAAKGAVLCDLAALFREHSPAGVIGWELMDDHVHPNLAGQALIARGWLHAMTQLPEPVHVHADALASLPSDSAQAERLGSNPYTSYGVAHRMQSLYRCAFYRGSNPEALARFESLCRDDEATMPPAALTAARRWQDARVHRAGHRPIAGLVGIALMEQGEIAEAEPLLLSAYRAVPPYSVWSLEYGWHALQCARMLRQAPEPADLALAHEMIEHGVTFWKVTGVCPPTLHRYLGMTYHALGEDELAVEHLSEAARHVTSVKEMMVIEALARSLVHIGQPERARALLTSSVRDPQLRKACAQLLAQLEAQGALSPAPGQP